MIRIRFAVGDESRRFFKMQRDGVDLPLTSIEIRLRSPSGAEKSGTGVIEDSTSGNFYVDFIGPLEFDEPGGWKMETIANNEHQEEPLSVWVRPEYLRGPR